MSRHEVAVKESIASYTHALKACSKMGLRINSENTPVEYFHTPGQKQCLERLQACQVRHKEVISEYAKHVGQVPEHFFARPSHTGSLIAPGIKTPHAIHATAFLMLLLAIIAGTYMIALNGENEPMNANGLDQRQETQNLK